MNLADLMREELICADLAETSKKALLRALVDILVDKGLIDSGDEVVRLLMKREELMSTGVHPGFALPHAFSKRVHQSVVVLAHIPSGADWQALDGEPVYNVFLLLGPPESQGIHLRLLARISRLLLSKTFVQCLSAAKTPPEMLQAVIDSEAELAPGRRAAGREGDG